MEKYYLAISSRKPLKKQGLIIGDMLKSRNGDWKLSKTRQHPAVTQFFSYSVGSGKRLFVLKPHTGKTHQLRVALKSIGAAILGDNRYGNPSTPAARMHLHAYCLRFTDQGHHYHYHCLPSGGIFSETLPVLEQQVGPVWQLPWPRIKDGNTT